MVEAALRNELTAHLFTMLPAPGYDLHLRARRNLRFPQPHHVFCKPQLIRKFTNLNIPKSQLVRISEALLVFIGMLVFLAENCQGDQTWGKNQF
jgi:hypothetical protein